MNIEYMREFVLLAETGHYVESAGRLYISQSTLSKHIKSMEEELKVPLFIRSTRKVQLSEYGRLLLPYAKKIVELQNEYSTVLFNNIDEERKKITIGSIPALAQYGITNALVRFKREHPGFHLTIIQAGSNELKEMLLDEKVELAFIREITPQQDQFDRIPYADDYLAVVLPENHPLSSDKTIELSQLAQEDFLLIERGTMLYELSIAACRKSGFEPNIAHTDHKIENIIDLVKQGMGVGLLTNKLALHNPVEGVAAIEIVPRFSTYINVCSKKDIELSLAARHFLKCMERY